MARMVSLDNLIARTRRRADAEGDAHKTEAEIIDLVNEYVPELHDLLVGAYGEDYFYKREIGTFTKDKPDYLLPADFYKLYGVDLETGANTEAWFPSNRFGERNRTQGEGYPTGAANWPEYRLRGRYVYFAPPPLSAIRYRLSYAPTAPVLIKRTFATGDVDTAQNRITLADHGLFEQHPVRLSTTDTLPGGTVATKTYYVSVVDDDTIQLLDAQDGNVVGLTSVGAGTHTIQSMFDGVNGWEALVVLKAAIALLAKEESDTRPLEREAERMEKRLREMAENRDSGEPEVIQDVQGDLVGTDEWTRWPPPL